MRDFIVRLASMKLAEMKFDVSVTIHDEGVVDGKTYYPDSSLIKIKELVSQLLVDERRNDLTRDLLIIQGSFYHTISQEIWRYESQVEIVIDKPKSMSLDLFRKIMGSAGLDDKRKIAQLIKGRKK